MTSAPSYSAGTPYRYVFSTQKSLLGTVGVYYCYANSDGDSWSIWHSVSALPAGALPQALAAYPWYSESTPKNVGVVAVGSNRRAYLSADTHLNLPWIDMGVADVAMRSPQPAPMANTVIIATEVAGTPSACITTVKEQAVGPWQPIPNSTGMTNWTAVYCGELGTGGEGSAYLIGPDYAGQNLLTLPIPLDLSTSDTASEPHIGSLLP